MADTTRITKLGNLTIANGTAPSGVINRKQLGIYKSIVIIAPAALTNVVTVQVADNDPDEASPNWRALHSPPGTAVTIAAGSAIVLTEAPFPAIRLNSAGNEGADRIFTVWGEPMPRN